MNARRPPAPRELPPVTISEASGVRYLHLGSVWVQGAMRIRSPQVVDLVYVQRMLASLMWLPPQALGQGRALQLGLGAGALTRFTAHQLRMPTTVVEINPQVVAVNERWFHLPREAEVVCGDAGAYLEHLAREAPGSVALLHVDLYDEEAAAPVLDDEAFYAGCRAVLQEGGVMGVNLFGRHASFSASIARIAAAFGADQVWSMQPTREGNTAVIAGRGVAWPEPAEQRRRADDLHRRFHAVGLQPRRWPAMVRPRVPGPGTAAAPTVAATR